MNKPSKNYNALAQLAAFSVGAECEAEHLSTEELDTRLSDQGIDLLQLEAATLRRVRRLKNEMNASMAAEQIRQSLRPRITVFEMRQVLESEGQLLAAKAKGTLADEDIEALYRLAHPNDQDDGS